MPTRTEEEVGPDGCSVRRSVHEAGRIEAAGEGVADLIRHIRMPLQVDVDYSQHFRHLPYMANS